MAQSPHCSDVDDVSFATEVIERSSRHPVLVDFWAPWCGPCRMLGPVLEELASEQAGAFHLAKVNTETSPQTAAAFGISSIPDVRLFVDGRVVAQFRGALPKSQVSAFLDTHLPSEAKSAFAEARALLAANDEAGALNALRRVIELDGAHAEARIELAALLLKRREVDEIAELLSAVSRTSDSRERADAMLRIAGFAEKTSQDVAQARAAVDADAGRADTQLALGRALAIDGDFEGALEHLLASLKIDRKLEDDAARLDILAIFEFIGIRSDLANRVRRKMSMYV